LTICTYKEKYSNYETKKDEIFHCQENCKNGKTYCIFHETFSIKDSSPAKISEMQKRLTELIDSAIKNQEDLKLIGFFIPALTIQNKRFKNVYCNYGKFFGNISINQCFFKNFSLNNSTFYCDNIDFSKNTFSGNVYAMYANLKGKKIDFSKIEYKGFEVNFNNTTLNSIQEIDFSNSHFPSAAFFQSTVFISQLAINFSNCMFWGQISFQTKFISNQLVMFHFSQFWGNIISFSGCEFYKRGVTFNQAKFFRVNAVIGFTDISFTCKEVSFHKITCFGEIQFTGSRFNLEKKVDFDHSQFFNTSNFKEYNFSKGIITFNNTNFQTVEFNDAQFSNVYFEKTGFKKTNFSHTKFLEKAYFFDCKCKDSAFFHYIIFEQPQKIIFKTHDLSNFSFINTDITRILFADNAKFGNDKKDLYKTYDERIFNLKFKKVIESKEEIELGDLLSLYRNLRENYEYRLRYDLAGKFFIREMELKRKFKKVNSIPSFAKNSIARKVLHTLKLFRYVETKTDSYIIKNNWWRRNFFSLIGIYRLISNYGESLFFAFIFISLIFFIFTIFWYFQSNATTTNPSIFQYKEFDNHTQWNLSLKRSISDLIPFFPFKIDPPSIYDYFLKALGVLSFGIVFISLKRKFERRFRH